MKVNVIQMHGCNKCFNETLLLNQDSDLEISRFTSTDEFQQNSTSCDFMILTGYCLPEDKPILKEIQAQSGRMIAYGSCSVSGGIFGLIYQKGQIISPLSKLIQNISEVQGCLGEIEELRNLIHDTPECNPKQLCSVCTRKSTCHYLEKVQRQINPNEEDEQCFNDFGFMCMGYIASECKERCIKSGAPCRGCKPNTDRAGIRMLGMFGTLMGNIEVATEATGKGGTDKLADKPDEITKGVPDIVGNFFRFELAQSILPLGRNAPKGNLWQNVFVGRLVEELPMLLGMVGGSKDISRTLDAIEAYESGLNLSISEKTKELRSSLRTLENELASAISNQDAEKYAQVSIQIRIIAGNRNLSNLFYGGFRTKIEGEDAFDEYKAQIVEFQQGSYASGAVHFACNAEGIITEFQLEGCSE